MVAATPFRISGREQASVGVAGSTVEKTVVTGTARFDGSELVLDWDERVSVVETGLASSRVYERESRSGSCAMPLGLLHSIELRTKWWRPRIEIIGSCRGEFPGGGGGAGRFTLNLERRDRERARELVADVQLALAERALQVAQRPPELNSGE